MATITIVIVHALMTDQRWACDIPRGALVPGAFEIDLDGVTCDRCFTQVAITRVVTASPALA